MATKQPLPASVPFTLLRGDTYKWSGKLEINTGTDAVPVKSPYDLTGNVLLAQIRSDKNRTDPVVATFTIDVDDDPTSGQFTLELPSSESDKLGDDGRVLWWDLQTTRTSDAFRRTWFAGKVTVKGDTSNA